MKKGAYLACGPNVDISATVQRDFVRGVFSGTGFFPLIARGNGPVAFSAYGTVALRELKPGEEWCVKAEKRADQENGV